MMKRWKQASGLVRSLRPIVSGSTNIVKNGTDRYGEVAWTNSAGAGGKGHTLEPFLRMLVPVKTE
jgi:hypothetical protein